MGIDIHSAQFLVAARKKGVSFEKVLMLGRQNLNVAATALIPVLEKSKISAERFTSGKRSSNYAEPLFESLGAVQVDSMDNSDFEGAQLVHDLNEPIPSEWRERYDVVFDGGTLEHVFQFPTALKNSMELVREGGRLILDTCANNWCGHGFYQFSPELFYRALSPENGFEVERMTLHRVGPYGSWYEVTDPNEIHSRVELITFTPMLMMVQAKRTSIKPIFSKPPQQSDYNLWWQQSLKSLPVPKKQRFPVLGSLLRSVRTGMEFYRRQSLFNRKFFKKVSRDE